MNANDKRGGKGDYRLININTLKHLSLEGQEYEVK